MTDAHLDDEGLSAVLDGEATPTEAAHTDACTTCSVRLGELRDASVLVGAPMLPPDPSRREAAITAALATEATNATVSLLRRRLPPAWVGVAAAVIVAVAAVAILPSGGNDDRTSTAAETTSTTPNQEAAADAFTLAAPSEAVDGGDLGDIDVGALRQTISAALGNPQTAESGAPATGDGGGAEADSSAGAASGQRQSLTCDPEVRANTPDLGPLVFHAIGTFDDEAVVVLAYEVTRPDGHVDRWVYVATVDGCAIRNQQTFAA